MRTARQPPPNLDLGLVAVCSALRLPAGAAAALFAVGRSAGWIAHALEQRRQGYLLRPRARYTAASLELQGSYAEDSASEAEQALRQRRRERVADPANPAML